MTDQDLRARAHTAAVEAIARASHLNDVERDSFQNMLDRDATAAVDAVLAVIAEAGQNQEVVVSELRHRVTLLQEAGIAPALAASTYHQAWYVRRRWDELAALAGLTTDDPTPEGTA